MLVLVDVEGLSYEEAASAAANPGWDREEPPGTCPPADAVRVRRGKDSACLLPGRNVRSRIVYNYKYSRLKEKNNAPTLCPVHFVSVCFYPPAAHSKYLWRRPRLRSLNSLLVSS